MAKRLAPPELQKGAFNWTKEELQVFTKTQIGICEKKANKKSYDEIMRKHSLRSQQNITTCIAETIKGNIWSPGTSVGGRPCFLSDVDIVIFKMKINQAFFDMDCINTKMAIQVMLELKDERLKRGKVIAYYASQKIPLPKSYQETIDAKITTIPSSSWLSKF